MADTTINNISTYGIKQYYVNGTDGASVVRVAFNPHSSTTSRTASGSGSGVLINIGTKNMSSSAAISNAVNKAVFSTNNINANELIEQSQTNILNSAEDAIRAASVTAPNEDVMGLLV